MWIMHGHLDQDEPVGIPSEPGGTEQAVEERTAAVPPMTDSITEHQPREAFDPEAGLPGYVLTHRLGQGSYGQVWQAVRVGAGQDVAVKIFTSPGRLTNSAPGTLQVYQGALKNTGWRGTHNIAFVVEVTA